MEFFRISTALPFGYVIIFFCYLVLCLITLIWIIKSIKRKPIKRLQLLFNIPILFFLILVGISNAIPDNTEWNPLVRNDSEILGVWIKENSQLILKSDYSYTCTGDNCAIVREIGRWERVSDFNITLHPSSQYGINWRLAKKEGKLQLVSGASGDPDMWRTEVEFIKK